MSEYRRAILHEGGVDTLDWVVHVLVDRNGIPLGQVLEETVVVILIELVIVQPDVGQRVRSFEVTENRVELKVECVGFVSTESIGLLLREHGNIKVPILAGLPVVGNFICVGDVEL